MLGNKIVSGNISCRRSINDERYASESKTQRKGALSRKANRGWQHCLISSTSFMHLVLAGATNTLTTLLHGFILLVCFSDSSIFLPTSSSFIVLSWFQGIVLISATYILLSSLASMLISSFLDPIKYNQNGLIVLVIASASIRFFLPFCTSLFSMSVVYVLFYIASSSLIPLVDCQVLHVLRRTDRVLYVCYVGSFLLYPIIFLASHIWSSEDVWLAWLGPRCWVFFEFWFFTVTFWCPITSWFSI